MDVGDIILSKERGGNYIIKEKRKGFRKGGGVSKCTSYAIIGEGSVMSIISEEVMKSGYTYVTSVGKPVSGRFSVGSVFHVYETTLVLLQKYNDGILCLYDLTSGSVCFDKVEYLESVIKHMEHEFIISICGAYPCISKVWGKSLFLSYEVPKCVGKCVRVNVLPNSSVEPVLIPESYDQYIPKSLLVYLLSQAVRYGIMFEVYVYLVENRDGKSIMRAQIKEGKTC